MDFFKTHFSETAPVARLFEDLLQDLLVDLPDDHLDVSGDEGKA